MSEPSSPSILGRLFGFIWRVVVVAWRALMIVAFLAFAGLIWMGLKGGPPPTVEDNVALVIAPTGTLVEQMDRDPGQAFFENLSGEPPSQSLLRDVTRALDAAADDDRIAFAVLKLDGLWDAGLPQLEELNQAVQRFQGAGKRVVAYGPWYDQSHYFAAAQADEIVLDPLGLVYMEGFSVYNNYFKEGLDKLGVDMHVFRVGEYKSAVEPYTRNDMSEEARDANREWLGDLWTDYRRAIADGREIAPETADTYIGTLAEQLQRNRGDAAGWARELGLVTHVETLVDFRKRMGETVGFDDDHGSFRQVHYGEYLRAVDFENGREPAIPDGKVALVVIQGEIVEGSGEPGQAGGDTITDLLDQARLDEEVAAVVLRIDSPGGSVWASEQIRRSVQQLKAEGKPVVASMSTVAASGGYWVAMDADQIWAHDSTITGSIGIFGLVPTIDRTLAKLGIHTDGVGTTPLAGAFRLDRPLSPQVAMIIQAQIDKGYRDFIEGVASARKLPVDKVDAVARGRVWSGGDAREVGLVDSLGGLDEAADAAAALAQLDADAYALEELAPERDFTSRLLQRFSSRFSGLGLEALPGLALLGRALPAQPDLQRALSWLNDPRGMYAHCFCTPGQGGRSNRAR